MLEHLAGLTCAKCGATYRPSLRSLCPACPDGGRLRFRYDLGRLERSLDRAAWARREPWLWRYRELLPFDEPFSEPPLQVGHTPLYGSPRLARYAGVRGLYVKDESRNPTGRTADRAAAVLVAQAEEGRALVAGPLAREVAAFAASAGTPLLALLGPTQDDEPLRALGAQPARLAPELERGQALLRVHREAGRALADRPNPLAFEGLKTLGLEIGEQLAERLPEWIALDASEPELLEAVGAALETLRDLGFFRQAPRLLAVDGPGGFAQISTTQAQRVEAAAEATRALGLRLEASGAVGLAGLRRAVEQGSVDPGATALVVLQGPAASSDTLQPGRLVRSFEDLLAAART